MKKSAGILLYRYKNKKLEVFLVHPGGPFWKGKESGAWTIPKGEFDEKEDALEAAIREFEEETGVRLTGPFLELNPIKQKSGKWVFAWSKEFDMDPSAIVSNTFKIEWPYKSGKWQTFPEIDKACWFSIEEATEKINSAQSQLISELQKKIT